MATTNRRRFFWRRGAELEHQRAQIRRVHTILTQWITNHPTVGPQDLPVKIRQELLAWVGEHNQ